MAAAYAALVSLMNNMEQIMSHPRLSKSFDNEQIQSLLEKAGFLVDPNTAPPVVRQIHVRSLDLKQLIQDMDAVVEKAMEIKERGGGSREEQQPIHSRALLESGASVMVGLDDELNQLLDELTTNHSNRHIISIVGMGGTGKTTLARNLLANLFVVDRFDIRAFATVSQQYYVEDILSQLLSCLGISTKGNVGELGELVHKTLYGRRYLVVLDDIWGVEAWDAVRRYLPDNKNKSRDVLTTRLSNVASDCG